MMTFSNNYKQLNIFGNNGDWIVIAILVALSLIATIS